MTPELVGPADPMEQKASQALQVHEQAEALMVTDNASYEAGVAMLKSIKRARSWWKDANADSIKKAKESLEAAKKLFNKIDNPLATSYDDLHDRCEAYLTQKREANRLVAARPPEPLAPRQPPPIPADVLEAEFDRAVTAGDVAKADKILHSLDSKAHVMPPPAAPPKPAAVPPKVDGVAVTDSWTYDIVREDQIPEEYWETTRTLNKKMIAGVVKSMKDKTNIPGIHARPDTTLRIRA